MAIKPIAIGLNNDSSLSSIAVEDTDGSLLLQTSGTEDLRITASGNVGIGITNPSQKLHVVGNSYVTGAYYDSNNATGTANQVLTSVGTGTSWAIPTVSTTQASSDSSTNIATTAYVKSLFGSVSTGGSLDWNDVTNTRPGTSPTLLLGTATSGPGGGQYFHPLNFEYNTKNGTGNLTQLAIGYNTNEIYMRYRFSSAWTSWVRVLNSNNYTSFSPTLTGGGASGTWGIAITGNAGTATTLATTRTLWGQNFNGGANVTGSLTSVGDITGTGAVTLTATGSTLALTATGANVITASTNGTERLRIDSSGNVTFGTPLSNDRTVRINSVGNTYLEFSTTGATGLHKITAGNGATAIASLAFETTPSTGIETERLRIDSVGNLLFIGAGTPGSTQAVSFSGAAPINSLVINSSGNVGIGTNSPESLLDVRGTITAGVNTSSTSGNDVLLQSNYTDGNLGVISSIHSSGALGIGYGVKGGGSVGTFLSTTGLSTRRLLYTQSSDGGHIWYGQTNASSVAIDSSVTLEERMRIDSSGNVGIGQSSITGVFGRTISATGTSGGATYRVAGLTTSAYIFTSDGLGYGGLYAETNNALVLGTNSLERLRIDSFGNVGIGTTNPTYTLSVVGTTQIKNTGTRPIGGAQLFLDGPTLNRIDFNTNGVAVPVVVGTGGTLRSVGTKIVLYSGESVNSTDYAFGVETNGLWYSVPTNASHKWYTATTNTATISSGGTLTLAGNISIGGSDITTSSTTGNIYDTTATTVNAFGATTTLNLGYDGTATNTSNIITGVTASGSTKTINLGTGGGSGSTTLITIGANTTGSRTISQSATNNLNNPTVIGSSSNLALTGPVTAFATSPTSAGTGYRDGVNEFSITGGTGTLAYCTVSVGGGIIRSIVATPTKEGRGYTTNDLVTLSTPVSAITVTGASGTGTTATLTFAAQNSLSVTATSGTGTTATLTFAAQTIAPYPVGSQIFVSGVGITGYNGTFVVTGCTTTTVSYANTSTGNTSGGTISIIPFIVGGQINVTSVNPAGYNATNAVVTACTATSVSYANTSTGYTSGGAINQGTATSNGTFTVSSVRQAGLSIINSTYPRLRLENTSTSVSAGTELGSILFGCDDTTAGGSGDKAKIVTVAENTSGGGTVQVWTSANALEPTLCAAFGGNNDFRLYNTAGTFYHAFTNNPTANRTISLPDANITFGNTFSTANTFTTSGNFSLTLTTTNTTNVTLPTTGTLATLSGTETLTNKTFDVLVSSGGTLQTSSTTGNVYNTTATTVNAFGAGTSVTIGATTGNMYLRNATVNLLGNLAFANGKGIDFSATGAGVSGTVTSQLFSDYEEGSWTPEYTGESVAGSGATYNLQTGRYIKVGDLVYIEGQLRTTGLGTTAPSGNIRISGLPYTVQNTTGQQGVINIGYTSTFNISHIIISGLAITNATAIALYVTTAAATSQATRLLGTGLTTATNGNYIAFSGCYRAV